MPGSCLAVAEGTNATTQNYTCEIGIRYYDMASTGWTINATIADSQNATAIYNETFTLGSLTAINMTPSNLTWAGITITTTDAAASENPVILGNIGNYNITESKVNITAYDLQGEQNTAEYITANNLTVNTVASAEGDFMENATSVNVTNSALPTCMNFGEDCSQAVEMLYFYVKELPKGISQQAYSSGAVGSWKVEVY